MVARDTQMAAPVGSEAPAFRVAGDFVPDLDLEPVSPLPLRRISPEEDPSAWRDPAGSGELSEPAAAWPGEHAFSVGGPAVHLVNPDDLDLPPSAVLSGARVTLGGVRDAGAEALLYDLSGTRILARHDGDAPSGDRMVLTFERADTAANYSRVLGSIRYLNRAEDASDGTRAAILETFDETGRAWVAAVTSVEVASPRERLRPEPAEDTRLAFDSIGQVEESASAAAAKTDIAAGAVSPHTRDARPGGVVETEAYSLVLDTGAGGFVDRLAAASQSAGTREPDDGHILHGDGAGTPLSFAPDGTYRVFDGGFPGTRAANENGAAGEFGLDENAIFDDAGSEPVRGSVPSGRTPAFDSLLVSPLAGAEDVGDTVPQTLTA